MNPLKIVGLLAALELTLLGATPSMAQVNIQHQISNNVSQTLISQQTNQALNTINTANTATATSAANGSSTSGSVGTNSTTTGNQGAPTQQGPISPSQISNATANYEKQAMDSLSSDSMNQNQRGSSDSAGAATGILGSAMSMGLGIASLRNAMGNANTQQSQQEAQKGKTLNSNPETAESAPPWYAKAATSAAKAVSEYGLAALSLAQAGMQMANAMGNSAKSGEDRTSGAGYNPFTGAYDYYGPNTGNDPSKGSDSGKSDKTDLGHLSQEKLETLLPNEGKIVLESLKEKGYEFDFKKGTITTPNGTVLSGNDFNDNAKLNAAFGAPKGSIEAALKNNSELEAQVAAAQGIDLDKFAKAGGLNGGLGGGFQSQFADGGMGDMALDGLSGDGNGFVDPNSPAGIARAKALANANKDRGLASTSAFSGLSAKFNGENIGVSQDNVFTMITRRYNLKRDLNEFLLETKPKLNPQTN